MIEIGQHIIISGLQSTNEFLDVFMKQVLEFPPKSGGVHFRNGVWSKTNVNNY